MRHTRPGSLTLLAILAFILAGFTVLGFFGQLMVLLVQNFAASDKGMQEAMALIPRWHQVLSLVWSAVSAALLIMTGIGLLKQAPILGRLLATVWSVLAMAMIVVDLSVMPDRHSALWSVLGLLYPVVLLVWVQVVCAEVWRPVAIPVATGGRAEVHPLALTAGQSLRQSLRAVGGPGFVLGYLFAGVLTAAIILAVAQIGDVIADKSVKGDPAAKKSLETMQSNAVESGTRWLIGVVLGEGKDTTPSATDLIDPTAKNPDSQSARWTKWLVRDHPPLLSFTWLLLSLLLVLAVPYASAGLIARDSGTRGFRFLLVRVDRDSVYLGRFLGAAMLVAASTVVLVAICALGLGFAQTQPDWGLIARWSGWAACALVLTALPYLALGQLFSSLVNHPFLALMTVKGAVILWPAVVFSLAVAWGPAKWLLCALPLGAQLALFHPAPWLVALAALACLGYTAIYLWLGLMVFRRKDL